MPSSSIHRVRIDPGDGTKRTGYVAINCWTNGALSVQSSKLEDKPWCLAVLQHAADAIRNQNGGKPLEPPADVDIQALPDEPESVEAPPPGMKLLAQLRVGVWSDGGLSIEGPILDRMWCLAAIENAKDAVRNHRTDRTVVVPFKDVAVPLPLHPMSRA
jgi:hypothetical protein